MATEILQQCDVAPSSGSDDHLLKLLHFDMAYLPLSPLRNLFLYEFQCSQSHFLDTIVPNLKNSLSLALQHFSPLAGKLLITNDQMPVFRYIAGEDSVPLSIAFSEADFESLTGYHPREAVELHDLAPHQLPESSLVAFQVTLFPNRGICIGVTSRHLICDGVSLVGFLRMWAAITRSNGDGSLDLSDCQPVFLGRDNVADGDRLAVEFLEAMKAFPSSVALMLGSHERVRATFVLSEVGIKTLQSRAFKDNMVRVSAFVVACAHLWTCLARSAAIAGERVSDDEAEYFSCSGDCRKHLNPPLPYTYFGNCMTVGTAESTHGELRGRDGFSSAVEAIGEAIGRMFDSDKGVMESSAKSLLRFIGLAGKRMLVVNGSPKLDFYGTTDYGWGRPVKFEPLQDHNAQVVFVSKSREQRRGGMEIAVLLPKPQMDAFAALFGEGLPMERVWCKM